MSDPDPPEEPDEPEPDGPGLPGVPGERRWGFVNVAGIWARVYVARWHPADIGTGRWP